MSAGSPDTSRFHGLSVGNTLQLPSGPFWAQLPPPDGAVVVVAGVVVVVTAGFVVVVAGGLVVVGAGGDGAGAGRHADNTTAPMATVTRRSRPRRMRWYRQTGPDSLKQG